MTRRVRARRRVGTEGAQTSRNAEEMQGEEDQTEQIRKTPTNMGNVALCEWAKNNGQNAHRRDNYGALDIGRCVNSFARNTKNSEIIDKYQE